MANYLILIGGKDSFPVIGDAIGYLQGLANSGIITPPSGMFSLGDSVDNMFSKDRGLVNILRSMNIPKGGHSIITAEFTLSETPPIIKEIKEHYSVNIISKEMYNVYMRVADAVSALAEQINATQVIMPIGLDGAVICHFLRCYWAKHPAVNDDCLVNTVQATSRFDELDEGKLAAVLQKASSGGKAVYGIDLRTKTGRLGSMLKDYVKKFDAETGAGVKFLYAVLFDPNAIADLRGSAEELTDNDRTHLYWVPSFEAASAFIGRRGTSWEYNLNHEAIAGLNGVEPIKRLL